MSIRGLQFKHYAIVLGFIAFVFGIYGLFFQTDGFVKSTASIVEIYESEDSTQDDKSYDVIVEYTVEGRTYREKLDNYSPTYKEGKTVTIYYNPADPSEIHGARGFYVYFAAVGGLLFFGTIIAEFRKKQMVKDLKEKRGEITYARSEQGEERELYFLTDLGTPRYGHRIEDRDRHVLYEAKMTKFSLLQPFEFDFMDHEHHKTTRYLIGHNESSEWGTLLIDNHYTFELEGVDVWKHLREEGVRIDSRFESGNGKLIGVAYSIFRNDMEIGYVETASQYPHEEDAEEHEIASKLPVNGFYRIWTKEKNLDLLFMVLVALARTGANDDSGGNYKAIFGIFKKR